MADRFYILTPDITTRLGRTQPGYYMKSLICGWKFTSRYWNIIKLFLDSTCEIFNLYNQYPFIVHGVSWEATSLWLVYAYKTNRLTYSILQPIFWASLTLRLQKIYAGNHANTFGHSFCGFNISHKMDGIKKLGKVFAV